MHDATFTLHGILVMQQSTSYGFEDSLTNITDLGRIDVFPRSLHTGA